MSHSSRVHAGTPTGGQFAPAVRDESEVTLPAATVDSAAEVDAEDGDEDLDGPVVDENGCYECGSSDGGPDTLCDPCGEVAEDGMPSWSELGFDKYEATDWSIAGFDPSEARAHIAAGFCI